MQMKNSIANVEQEISAMNPVTAAINGYTPCTLSMLPKGTHIVGSTQSHVSTRVDILGGEVAS